MTRFAGSIDLTDYLGEGCDWSKATDAQAEGRSSNRVTAIQGQSLLSRTGLNSLASVKSAEEEAEAIKAGAAAEASAKTYGSIVSGISSLGSAGIKAYGKANNLGIYGG